MTPALQRRFGPRPRVIHSAHMEARVEDSDSFQRAFGEALIAAGKLDKSGLERATRLANGRDESLANVLAKLGLVNERDLAAALAAHLNVPLVEPVHIPDTLIEIGQLSPKFLKQRRILPLAQTEEGYVLAMADPLDAYAIDAFQLATGQNPVICVAERTLKRIAVFNPGFHRHGLYHRRPWSETPPEGGWSLISKS